MIASIIPTDIIALKGINRPRFTEDSDRDADVQRQPGSDSQSAADPRNSHHRPHRQIDAGGDDHEGRPYCKNPDYRGLQGNRYQVLKIKEIFGILIVVSYYSIIILLYKPFKKILR